MQGSHATASATPLVPNWTHEEVRLWQITLHDPKDYNSFEALIKAVENHTAPDPDKIIAVYHHILLSFPLSLCHRKAYAVHLKKFNMTDDAIKLYEEAPLLAQCCVEFWLDFYECATSIEKGYDFIKELLWTAIENVGSYYDSKQLWEVCVKHEQAQGHWQTLSWLYAQMMENPFKGMESLLDKFKELTKSVPLDDLINWVDRADSFPAKVSKLSEKDKVRKYVIRTEESYKKAKAMEEKIIEFESSIRRFDFQPGRVEDDDVLMWYLYLDFMEKEHPEKVQKLFKRCLIPCSTRVDMWIRYVEFLEDNQQHDDAINALSWANQFVEEEAKLDVRLLAARLKERTGDLSGARDEYISIQKEYNPVPLKVLEAHAAFHYRLGNSDGAYGVFQDAIDAETRNGSGMFSPALRLKFARFALVVLENPSRSKEILTGLLDLELTTPVVEGIIDIASALPEKERTEFLECLDCLLLKFILADASNDILSEYSDKRNVSLLYLEFLDSFGKSDMVYDKTRRHFSCFRRSNTLVPRRRLGSAIDTAITKKLKMDHGIPEEKQPDVIIITLQEFLSKHLLIEDKLMDVGILKGHMITKITQIGRRLLRALYRALLQRHDCMLSWNGIFDARDIMVTYDGTPSSSILCSFRKEPSKANDDWIHYTKNDHINLQNILKQHFLSKTTNTYPCFLSELFTFALFAPPTTATDKCSRTLFLEQIAQQPIFRSSSAYMNLCREIFSYLRVSPNNTSWLNINFTGSECEFKQVLAMDKLINQVFGVQQLHLKPSPSPGIGASTYIKLIRHIEAHASDHFQMFSMSMDTPEDLFDLIGHHYAKFIGCFVMELCGLVKSGTCDTRLVRVYQRYSESY